MQTRMERMKSVLTDLHEERDFDRLFKYAVKLAGDLIESDRIGRIVERVEKDFISQRKRTAITREFLKRSMLEVDEFYDEEKDFYEHFDNIIYRDEA